MRHDAEPWWRQAVADLDTARVTLDGGRFYAAVWFVQQAVEKVLKALYLEQRGVLAPRTHNLNFLGTEVGAPAGLVSDLRELNPAFDLSRYPDPTTGDAPVDSVGRQAAEQHLAGGERVLRWIASALSTPF